MTARLRARVLALLGALALVLAPLLTAQAARADANSFSYASWTAQYQLSRDDNGRAKLLVTETLVADFPAFDQNHGIIRGLPTWYDGAPLDLRIVSVTDGKGTHLPYDNSTTDNGERQLKIGDADVYQHGLTTYRIQYTMRDVVHRPSDRQIDEWYWNLLPLNSQQPITHFSAVLMFDPAISAAKLGAPSCYVGPAGSTTPCALTPDASSAKILTVAQDDVPAGSGVTVAFPMKLGTFAQAPARVPDAMTDVVPFPLAAAGALLAIGGPILGISLLRRSGRRRGRGIVVAQYDVPAALPPVLAAELEGRKPVANSAEIVHLAVHASIRIEDGESKPVLELQDASVPADPLDAEALHALFPGSPVGTKLYLDIPNDPLVSRLKTLTGSAHAAAFERGLFERRRSPLAIVLSGFGLAAGLGAVALATPGMAVGRPAAIAAFVVAIVLSVVALVALLVSLRRRAVLTAQGAEAREYLLGVREYIRLAEADRIRMLQSYRGAERRKDGSVDIVVLYERLLPYAMLFGMEREWGQVLAVQYLNDDIVPAWYLGYTGASFAGSLSGMGSALTATPTPSSSSSSSGSFGGGFSGGGGGGGSSGGW
ncbi:DUF2207 family protein [Microbacterium panaciterrae]|uniref:DUF2207 domain-containing protein n=1 Tax=Microbacterium panaciterrae TaxID=985759 RepID=A0ABP8PA65_9MICO